MADIASSDVVYVDQNKNSRSCDQKVSRVFSVAFGNGVLTYPAGGVPLLKGSLGCPNSLESLKLVDAASANGFVYKCDLANQKIRIYQGDNDNVADAPLIELVGGAATPAAATLIVEVSGF